jgi:hypothetical protein
MKLNHRKTWAAVAALALTGPALALELNRAETSATRIVPPDPIRPYLEVSFQAELLRLTETAGEVVVGWGEVGGVQPTPFRLVIPADCFARSAGSLQVRNHRACGVSAELTAPNGEVNVLPVFAFSAVLTEVRGYGRLAVSAAVGVESRAGDLSSVLLSTFGGAEQSVVIGEDSASLLPNDLTVLGFNPQPEPPPLDFLTD